MSTMQSYFILNCHKSLIVVYHDRITLVINEFFFNCKPKKKGIKNRNEKKKEKTPPIIANTLT